MTHVEVVEVAFDHPDSAWLRAQQRAELEVRYGRDDSEPGVAPTASDITVFFVAFVDERAVGCGGLRQLDDEHGEIKRMFVHPEARGTGVSTAILDRLEDYARGSGWSRLVLETGTGQPDAVRFYEREGYTPIPLFGYYIGSAISLCYEKVLDRKS